MKSLVSTLLQRSTLMVTSFVLAVSSLSAAMPLFLSQTANAVGTTYDVCSSGCTYSTIQDAITAASSGDTIDINSDLTPASQVNISKPLTINGNNHTITAASAYDGNHFIYENNVSGITVSNLTVDVNGFHVHGINAFKGSMNLNDVTLKNSTKDGLLVNGADVTVNNIKTSGNSWYGINVDQSSTSNPAILTVNGISTHGEATAILVSDITKNVSVNDNSNQYVVSHYGNTDVYRLNPSLSVPASQTTQVVRPANLPTTGWYYWNDNTDTLATTGVAGEYNIVTDPADSNKGALEFNSPNKLNIATNLYAGTKLTDIAAIGYSSYNTSAQNASTYMQFNVSFDGSNNWQNRLTFIPANSNGAWQQNEGIQGGNGLWEWSKMTTGGSLTWPDGSTSIKRTWNDIVTAFPNAKIQDGLLGQLLVRSEHNTHNYIDNVYVATSASNVKYNFELPDSVAPIVSNIKMFVNGTESTFMRPGDSIKVVATVTDPTLGSGVNPSNVRLLARSIATTNGGYIDSGYFVNNTSGDTYERTFTFPADGKYIDTHKVITQDLNGLRFYIKAYDNAGNYTNSAATTFTNDQTIPSMQNIKFFVKNNSGNYVASSDVKAGDQARVEVEATDQTSGIKNVEFRIQDASTGAYVASRVYEATSVGSDIYRYDFTVPADGNYTNTHGPITTLTNGLKFWARAYDNAGNYGNGANTNGLSGTFTYDNTAPTVQITSPASGQFVKGNTLTIKGSANDSNNFNYYYCYVTLPGSSEVGVRGADCNTTWRSVTNDVLGTVNISGLADGNYEAHLVAYDKAGNHSDLNYFVPFTLDNSAPQVDTITLNSVSVTSPRVTNCGPTNFNLIRGNADLGAMIDDGTGAGTDSASYRILKVTNSGCTMSNPAHDYGGGVFGYQSNTVNMIHSGSNWATPSGSVLDTKALGLNGKYTIALTTKDTLGNTTIQYIDLDIDNTKPSISASLSDTLINSTDANPILTVNANDSGSGVAYTQYSIMDSTMTKILGWFTIPGSTTDTVDVSSLGDGDYTVRARAFDNAGNKKSGADVAFTIDRTAPAVTINTPSAITVGTPTTTITGTNDNLNNIITVSIGGGTPITVPSVDVTNTAWSLVVDTSALGVGTHSITVLASDLAGNVSDGTAASANADLAVNAVPAVQPQVNSIQSPATPGNTGTGGGTGTQTVTPGEVLGDQTTNNDATKTDNTKANPSPSILGDTTSNPMNLFGLAWYWWLVILVAIIAAWWIIAAALRRRDNENA